MHKSIVILILLSTTCSAFPLWGGCKSGYGYVYHKNIGMPYVASYVAKPVVRFGGPPPPSVYNYYYKPAHNQQNQVMFPRSLDQQPENVQQVESKLPVVESTNNYTNLTTTTEPISRSGEDFPKVTKATPITSVDESTTNTAPTKPDEPSTMAETSSTVAQLITTTPLPTTVMNIATTPTAGDSNSQFTSSYLENMEPN